MTSNDAFDTQRNENMVGVGAVGVDWARVWVRMAEPGRYELMLRAETKDEAGQSREQHEDEQRIEFKLEDDPATDGTRSVLVGNGDEGQARPLEPATRYCGHVRRFGGSSVLGSVRFETAPRTSAQCPDHFSIALMSCHQPFDDDGHVVERALKALSVLDAAFEHHAVKRVILIGDQMYADYPRPLSLFAPDHFRRVGPAGRRTIFDCTREEVRRLYQDRYRVYLNVEKLAELLSKYPCYMIPDDHELWDNFGSHPDHSKPGWSSLREGALDACYDYEGLRTHARQSERPSSMHFTFEYGPVACFVMDLRSQKRATEKHVEIYDDEQFEALERYLDEMATRPFMLLGLSVPFVHVPEWLATFGDRVGGEDTDAADRWVHARAHGSWSRMLRLLHGHQRRNPEQRMVLLGGDVHTGVAMELVWAERHLRMHQLVSSAISNLENLLFRQIAEILPKLSSGMVLADSEHELKAEIMPGLGGRDHNPYSGLNFGLLEFRRADGNYTLTLKLVTHDDGLPPRPRVIFESQPL